MSDVVFPPLPAPDADERAVVEWTRVALAALDARPRERNWRFRAVGATTGQVWGQTLAEYRIDVRIPEDEIRILKAVATDRDLGVRTYVRRAIGTCLVVCDAADPDTVPSLIPHGVLRPR